LREPATFPSRERQKREAGSRQEKDLRSEIISAAPRMNPPPEVIGELIHTTPALV